MARPTKELPSRSSLVPAIVRHAAARGVDVEALAWRFALPQDVGAREEVIVGADVVDELLRTVARVAAEPDVSLRVASERMSRTLGLVELIVRASPDVRAGLEALARSVPLLHEGLEASTEEGPEGETRWVLRTPRRPRGAGRHLHELALAHALHHVRAAAGDLAASRVWFAHARPAELAPIRVFFGTGEVAFGCEDSGLALSRAALGRPMRAPDARTVETLTPLVEAELGARPRGASLSDRVAAHVASSLPGAADVGAVARAMHMSSRTLQRRLEQEETRFTEVLDRVRLDAARRLLADPVITLTDVAFRLGFADLATFSRAFKRWTGTPPGQWRRS